MAAVATTPCFKPSLPGGRTGPRKAGGWPSAKIPLRGKTKTGTNSGELYPKRDQHAMVFLARKTLQNFPTQRTQVRRVCFPNFGHHTQRALHRRHHRKSTRSIQEPDGLRVHMETWPILQQSPKSSSSLTASSSRNDCDDALTTSRRRKDALSDVDDEQEMARHSCLKQGATGCRLSRP